MKTVVAVAALLVAAVAAPASSSSPAADECRGLLVCIPVSGPWVAIPAPGAPEVYPSSRWQLRCPEGVVGGLDVRLSNRAIDVDFAGLTGSPVNPGITTTNAAVFTGTYTGRARTPTSFRPFIGCIPGGGGGRIPTSVSRPEAFKPGRPTTIRALVVRVVPGRLARVTHSCRPGEQLVRSSHAVGFHTTEPPSAEQLRLVRATHAVHEGQILVSASRPGLAGTIRVSVQVLATCTRRVR